MKFEDKIRNFMNGRYGPDELYVYLFLIYIALLIINLFVRSRILNFTSLIVVVYMFYRFFSKNIYSRTNENQSIKNEL
jgi:hypothetical protein